MDDGFPLAVWQRLAEGVVEAGSVAAFLERPTAGTPRLLLEDQRRLQRRAAQKVPDPERWLWTRKLLEQASDHHAASLMASFFPDEVPVIDICCGAGADSLALAQRGPLTAVDASAVACWLAWTNLRLHRYPAASPTPSAEVARSAASPARIIHAFAERLVFDPAAWLHIDPDRRSAAGRTVQVEHFQPARDFLGKLVAGSAGGSIKVAPATPWETPGPLSGRPEAEAGWPDAMGIQFVSWGRSVRQQRWWWNVEQFPPGHTTLSVFDEGQRWSHWTVPAARPSLQGVAAVIEENAEAIEGYVGDGDPGLRAARLQPRLAEARQWRLIGGQQGYFLCRSASPPPNDPLIDWFAIEAVMPLDRKRLRRYFRQHGVGCLEIKTRGVDCQPEQLRRELKLAGENSRSLLLTRCSDRVLAVVASRFPRTV
jgi:hypothetical protein